jgi:MerR family transcriptional regulator, redox-sensitive transcriptional activator SoxR
MHAGELLTIGELGARAGLSVSAIRFYEGKGLLAPIRSAGNQRRFLRADIRRLAFIRIAQNLGLSIEAIAAELTKLPQGRAPTPADWARISRALRGLLDERIAALTRTRDLLDGCIGCGCLSMKHCALWNPGDRAASGGAGPRYVLGDRPEPVGG